MLLRQIFSTAIVSALLILSGCGGGGGSTNNGDPPNAATGVLFTFIDTEANGFLGASDPENGTLIYSIVSNGSLGTAIITDVNTGAYTYTPNPVAEGTDTFTFRVNDGTSDSNIAVVTVHIAFDNPPIANDDIYSLDEGATTSVGAESGVLANDADIDNQALTVTLVSNVSYGTLLLHENGSFIYTHNGSETTSDSFSYKASDGIKDSEVRTVTFTVNPVNDPPAANGDSYNLDEGGQLNIGTAQGVLANDSDTDGPVLTAKLISDVSNGTLTLSNDGSFVYTHNGSETTSDSFAYQANDGINGSNTAVVTISINPLNDAPVAANDAGSVFEESVLNVSAGNGVLANDSDPEQDPFTITAFDTTSNIGANVNVNNDGSYSYDATAVPAVQALSAGQQLVDHFTYTISDGNGGISTGTVNITITGQNDLPVANADSKTTNDTSILNVPAAGLLANDSDTDTNDVLSVTSHDTTSALGASITVNPDGSYIYDPTVSATLQALDIGDPPLIDTFTYTMSDGHGGSDSATVTITVNGSNTPPVANNDNGQTITEDSSLSVSANGGVLNNDSDAEDGAGSNLTIIASSTTSTYGADVSVMPDGSYNYDPRTAGTIQALGSGEQLHDTFTYTVRDSGGATATGTVSIFVNGVNDAPIVAGSCGATSETQNYSGTLAGTDFETPSLLMFSLGADGSGGSGPITTANGGQVTIVNSTTGEFVYDPQFITTRGTDSFTYRVEDPDGAFTTGSQTIIVDQKIMPLGDSITRGAFGGGTPADSEKIGYRKPLYDGLVADGYGFDFVGSVKTDGTNPIYQPFDIDSEGHGGLWTRDIAFGITGYPTDGVRAWLDQNPADIVLLHIGTNGMPNLGPTVNADDVMDILDEVDLWENTPGNHHVTVLLARITDWDPINPDVATFNDLITNMALDRVNNPSNSAYPDDIIMVDQHSALNYPDDLTDSAHPNPGGYGKMAATWQTALEGVLDKCPP